MNEPVRLSHGSSADDAELRSALAAARRDVPTPLQLEALAEGARAATQPRGPRPSRLLGLGALVLVAVACIAALLLRTPASKLDAPSAPLDGPVAATPTRASEPVESEPARAPVQQAEPPHSEAPAATRHARVHRPARAVAPPPARTPADEVALLQQARRQVLAAPARALRLVQEHERDFRDGAFREEREALAVEALWRLGEGERARSRFASFCLRYPRSAYRVRLTHWLEDAAP